MCYESHETERRVQDELRLELERELIAEAREGAESGDADGVPMFADSPVPEPLLQAAN